MTVQIAMITKSWSTLAGQSSDFDLDFIITVLAYTHRDENKLESISVTCYGSFETQKSFDLKVALIWTGYEP